MMADIYYGVVKKECLEKWGQNHDPYNLLEERLRIYNINAWDFLFEADKFFTEKYQMDWGSFAYRCTKKQLTELEERFHCGIEKLEDFDEHKIYAIVFIEQV